MSLDGILVIDKPLGMTSHDVVCRVRRKLNMKAVGHSGTLDPMASGVMILLLGQGTRLSPYYLNGDKAYEVDVKLGVTTETWDMDGKILQEKPPVDLGDGELNDLLCKYSGALELQVPSISAVKVNGKKLYEYVRNGEPVPVVKREMNFKSVKLVSRIPMGWKAELVVSKGSFIRSWAHSIGEELGCGAAVSGLRRTSSFPYTIKDSVQLVEFENCRNINGLKGFIPLSETLPNWPQYVVRGRWKTLVENGTVPDGMKWELNQLLASDDTPGVRVKSADDGRLISLMLSKLAGNKIKVACVFK